MNAATHLHLRRLLCAHSAFSGVARVLGLDPRMFRHQRNTAMPMYIRRAIANAARVLFLRFILQELLRGGVLSRAQLRAAAAAARERLDNPEKGSKRALQQLAKKEGAAGRAQGPARKRTAKRDSAETLGQTRLPGT